MNMDLKKNLCRGLGNRSLPVLFSVLLFASCQDDLQTSVHTGPGIRFSVSDGAGWRATRAEGSPAEETTPRDSLLGVLPLQAADGGEGLYLHAMISDNTGNALADDERIGTRSAPVKDMETYGNFGVLAYLYTGAWDGSATPGFMYNTEVRGDGGVWSPAADHNWPGEGQKLRFFAYAPYNTPGIELPAQHEAGYPGLTYTVPEKVQDQKDLLVAASGEMAGDHNATAPLTFSHALTAVRFVVGDDMQKGSVTKIALRGVYGKAVYDMDGDSWSAFEETKDFSQTLDKKVDGQPGNEITSGEGTFMMIPQQLPQGAEIEVVFTDDLTGTERTLKADIAGATWPQGKTVTYRISTSSILVVPTFEVTAPEAFTYQGGTSEYSVTSYLAVSREGDATQGVPLAWTAEFVEDDGSGGYNVIDRPEWLTAFTASGNGGTSATMLSATIAAQQGVTSNPHNEVLRAAAPVSGTYDLSTKGGTEPVNTANCYVINAPGTYSLPLVYGNAVKNGAANTSAYIPSVIDIPDEEERYLTHFVNHLDSVITDPYIYNNANCTPANATLVWQDEPELVTNVRLSPDKRGLLFDVPQESIKQGNAIVAVRDAANTIMWSWHIWVTDFVPGLPPTVEERYDPRKTQRDKVVTNYQGVQYTFMGNCIGYCYEGITTYDARSVKVRFTQAGTGAIKVITLIQTPAVVNPGNAPYYQFGRKDPMLPGMLDASGSSVDKSCYSDGYAFKLSNDQSSIGASIQNPHIFYGVRISSWFSGALHYYNLWSADNMEYNVHNDNAVVKTIYDPSPVGYHLPASNAFTGFTFDGTHRSGYDKINTPYRDDTEATYNFGMELYCNKMMGQGSYDTAGGTVFFSFAGQRPYQRGKPTMCGIDGTCWKAVYATNTVIRRPYIVAPENTYSNASAYLVQPVRE